MTIYLQGPLMDVISNKHTRLNKLKGLNVTLVMWEKRCHTVNNKITHKTYKY